MSKATKHVPAPTHSRKAAKPLQAAKPAVKRDKKAPASFSLTAWLAGYDAAMHGVPVFEVPRGLHRASWKAGHFQQYKHWMLYEAIQAARKARAHGGEELAEVADRIGFVGHPQYMLGFKDGVGVGANLVQGR
jgi:hypothetical protein